VSVPKVCYAPQFRRPQNLRLFRQYRNNLRRRLRRRRGGLQGRALGRKLVLPLLLHAGDQRVRLRVFGRRCRRRVRFVGWVGVRHPQWRLLDATRRKAPHAR
jgi:hypothetical protein